MEKECFFAPNGPPAQGPYSHAVAVPMGTGKLLFVSGQGPVASDGTGLRKGTMQQEARLTLSNLKTILEDAGSSMDNVVKVNVYLSDMNHFAAFNDIYKEFFPANCPARTCIQAGRLPFDIQVEIEAIALIP